VFGDHQSKKKKNHYESLISQEVNQIKNNRIKKKKKTRIQQFPVVILLLHDCMHVGVHTKRSN
jgi:hypothetical protein